MFTTLIDVVAKSPFSLLLLVRTGRISSAISYHFGLSFSQYVYIVSCIETDPRNKNETTGIDMPHIL